MVYLADTASQLEGISNMPHDEKNKSLDYAREQVGHDPMAQLLGLELVELQPRRAVVALTPQARHLNALGVVHGTTLYAMLDQAAAIACNTSDYRAVLCQSTINFLSAARPEYRLRAEAAPLSIKRRLSVWEIKITDERGELVAVGQSTAYHFV